jgi:sec-independent protein translocase protein TatB
VFDVGFWELLFVLTLALLVLGPDKLPGAVSSVGRWLGRARVLARGLKMQIERELDKPVASASSASDSYDSPEASQGAGSDPDIQDTETADDAAQRDQP